MNKNNSRLQADTYDEMILATIPFYNQFYQNIIQLVKACRQSPKLWIDTGCGTGNVIGKVGKFFPGTEFILADPSEPMLNQAKEKIKGLELGISYHLSDTQSLNLPDNSADVISAVLCHHYLDKETRQAAVENCFRMLKPKGLLIYYENIRPFSEQGTQISLQIWQTYQVAQGKSQAGANNHISRFDTEYFPITATQHLELLKQCGFRTRELFWFSNMQAGFYGIK